MIDHEGFEKPSAPQNTATCLVCGALLAYRDDVAQATHRVWHANLQARLAGIERAVSYAAQPPRNPMYLGGQDGLR